MSLKTLTLTELLALAFKKYAVQSTEREHHSFVASPNVLHSTIFDLRRKYGDVLIPLNRAHFSLGGAFPFSQEVSDSMSMMFASGVYRFPRTGVPSIVAFYLGDDSESLILEKMKIFSPEERVVFEEFVQEFGASLTMALAP